jgi:hypothetical protein
MLARRAVLSLLAVVCCVAASDAVAPPARLTAQQHKQWEQRTQRLQRANALIRAGQRDEAIAAVRKALKVERAVLGQLSSNGLVWLNGLARLQEDREQFAGVIASRRELLAGQRQRYDAAHWRVIDSRLDLEDALLLVRLSADQRQRLRQAEQCNQQVVVLWQQGRSAQALPLAQ